MTKQLEITNEERTRWAAFMQQTWQAIAGDALQCCHESGQRVTRDIIIEMVLDANRMLMYSGIHADEERVLCEAYYGHGRFKRSPNGFKKFVRDTLNYSY
jgi:hypothetical protein